ncbi:hypothetical protein J6590_011298 [Homalodisca vitripennis]|nr:hypothetical protein J6590_011298 [Homalodisca vitripennis]
MAEIKREGGQEWAVLIILMIISSSRLAWTYGGAIPSPPPLRLKRPEQSSRPSSEGRKLKNGECSRYGAYKIESIEQNLSIYRGRHLLV